jgi:hypothetical protein
MKSKIIDYILILNLIIRNLKDLNKIKKLDFSLVTASDEQHYLYLENLLITYKKETNKNKFNKIFIFDLGLSTEQIKKIVQYDFVELRKFPFDNFPSFYNKRLENHNYKLGGFAWKPAIIDILKKEEVMNIIWLDSACTFNTKIFLFKLLIFNYGFASFESSGLIKDWTHVSVLKKLKIFDNEALLNSSNLMAGVVGFSFRNELADSLLKGWNKLANQEELIFPKKSTILNHRHDQSLLSILYWSMTNNKLPSNISTFGIKIQNWPNKILFFYDEKKDIRKKLLKKYLFNSTTTNKRAKVIVLLNAKSLKKIPLRLIFTKKVILFITDSFELNILKKFKIKKQFVKVYLDANIDNIYNQKEISNFNLDNIDEIITKEYRIALNEK